VKAWLKAAAADEAGRMAFGLLFIVAICAVFAVALGIAELVDRVRRYWGKM